MSVGQRDKISKRIDPWPVSGHQVFTDTIGNLGCISTKSRSNFRPASLYRLGVWKFSYSELDSIASCDRGPGK